MSFSLKNVPTNHLSIYPPTGFNLQTLIRGVESQMRNVYEVKQDWGVLLHFVLQKDNLIVILRE